MRQLAAALVAGAVACVACSDALGASPQPRLVAENSYGVGVDAHRIAFNGLQSVRVVDTRTWHEQVLPTPQGCGFAGLGGGHYALWNCWAPSNLCPQPRIVDLRTEAVVFMPGPNCDHGEYVGVGRHWLRASVQDPHYAFALYIPWSQGRSDSSQEAADRVDRPRVVADLNLPELARPLCWPLRRPRNPRYDPSGFDSYGGRYLGLGYAPPYALDGALSTDRFWLLRCGTRRKRAFRGENPGLGGGLLTWEAGDVIRGLVLRTGRRFAWNWRRLDPGAEWAHATQTANTVFIYTENLRVFAVRWRR